MNFIYVSVWILALRDERYFACSLSSVSQNKFYELITGCSYQELILAKEIKWLSFQEFRRELLVELQHHFLFVRENFIIWHKLTK